MRVSGMTAHEKAPLLLERGLFSVQSSLGMSNGGWQRSQQGGSNDNRNGNETGRHEEARALGTFFVNPLGNRNGFGALAHAGSPVFFDQDGEAFPKSPVPQRKSCAVA
tara:strand:- start:459 stop:782 length:324 start_codon:yes stop_codon:yes gene_type:complete